jgi:hypothetical protein
VAQVGRAIPEHGTGDSQISPDGQLTTTPDRGPTITGYQWVRLEFDKSPHLSSVRHRSASEHTDGGSENQIGLLENRSQSQVMNASDGRKFPICPRHFLCSRSEASIMNAMRLVAAMMLLFGAVGQRGGKISTLTANQTKNALGGAWEISCCSIYNPTYARREKLDVSQWKWKFKRSADRLTFSWEKAPKPIIPSEIEGTVEIADIHDAANPGELAVDLIFKIQGQMKVYRGRGLAMSDGNQQLEELWLVLPAEWEDYRPGGELTVSSGRNSQSSRPAEMEQGENSRARSFFLQPNMQD